MNVGVSCALGAAVYLNLLKPLGQMNRNLVGSIYGRFSIKIAHFVPIRKKTWPPQGILVSDWLISIKSSPLKPLGQMNRNLVGSILGRFSIRFINVIVNSHAETEHFYEGNCNQPCRERTLILV